MHAHRAVCAPHNRHQSVAVIVIMVVIMIPVMIVSVVMTGVVVVHHDAPAIVDRHDATAKRQGTQQDTEND